MPPLERIRKPQKKIKLTREFRSRENHNLSELILDFSNNKIANETIQKIMQESGKPREEIDQLIIELALLAQDSDDFERKKNPNALSLASVEKLARQKKVVEIQSILSKQPEEIKEIFIFALKHPELISLSEKFRKTKKYLRKIARTFYLERRNNPFFEKIDKAVRERNGLELRRLIKQLDAHTMYFLDLALEYYYPNARTESEYFFKTDLAHQQTILINLMQDDLIRRTVKNVERIPKSRKVLNDILGMLSASFWVAAVLGKDPPTNLESKVDLILDKNKFSASQKNIFLQELINANLVLQADAKQAERGIIAPSNIFINLSMAFSFPLTRLIRKYNKTFS